MLDPVCVSAREVVRLADYQGEQVSDSGRGGGLQRGGGHGHAAGHRQFAVAVALATMVGR
jgi:hypothetical protein